MGGVLGFYDYMTETEEKGNAKTVESRWVERMKMKPSKKRGKGIPDDNEKKRLISSSDSESSDDNESDSSSDDEDISDMVNDDNDEDDDIVQRARLLQEVREQNIIEEENKNLDNDLKREMLESFYNQTIGSVFVWTLETVFMSVVVLGVYDLAKVTNTQTGKFPVFLFWSTVSMVAVCALMAVVNTIIAFSDKSPALYSRMYMMCTKACCGCISCIGTVFTCVSLHSLVEDQWSQIFFPTNRSHLHVILVVMALAQNALWLVCTILTYSATPFGVSNSAFLEIPVCTLLIFFYILTHQTGTNRLLVCTGQNHNLAAFAIGNIGLFTSFGLFVLSATEFGTQFMGAWARSDLQRAQRLDPWAFLHGLCLVVTQLVYAYIIDVDDEMLFAAWAIAIFTVVVTVIQSFDVKYALRSIFQTDDETERTIRHIEERFAMTREDAREISRDINLKKINRLQKRTKKAKFGLGMQFINSQNGKEASQKEPPSLERNVSTGPLTPPDDPTVGVRSGFDEGFGTRNRRRGPKVPTAVNLFPNIPLTMMREYE